MEAAPKLNTYSSTVAVAAKPPIPNQAGKSGKSSKLFWVIIPVLFIVLAAGIFFIKFRHQPGQQSPTATQAALSPKPPVPGVIAKVGREYIYQKDLTTELAYYPAASNSAQEKQNEDYLLNKIINDSVVLQGASAEGLIKLDPTIFNSQDKDYMKRVGIVQQLEQTIDNNSETLAGTIVGIGVLGFTPTSSLTYDQAKSLAYSKLSKLHDEVVSGKLSITDAGKQISNDTSLASLDPSYQSDAGYGFSVHQGDRIFYNQQMDNTLWKLNPGQVSDIYSLNQQDLASSGQKTTPTDVFYAFGEVLKKSGDPNIKSLDDWLASKRKQYEVIYY